MLPHLVNSPDLATLDYHVSIKAFKDVFNVQNSIDNFIVSNPVLFYLDGLKTSRALAYSHIMLKFSNCLILTAPIQCSHFGFSFLLMTMFYVFLQ